MGGCGIMTTSKLCLWCSRESVCLLFAQQILRFVGKAYSPCLGKVNIQSLRGYFLFLRTWYNSHKPYFCEILLRAPIGECGQSIFPAGRRLRRRLILAVLLPLHHVFLQKHMHGSAVSGQGHDAFAGEIESLGF